MYSLPQSYNQTSKCKRCISSNAYDKDGNDILRETIDSNYRRVKQEIIALVESETERIKNNTELSRLLNHLN